MKSASLALMIARRFRRGRKRNGIVAVVSIISTISIALGVAVLIIGLSAMNGFERELNTRVLSVIPHGEISLGDGPLSNWQTIAAELRQQPGIEQVSPYVDIIGLVDAKNRLQAVQIKGIEQGEMGIASLISPQTWASFGPKQDAIILGQGVAQTLGVNIGDGITLLAQQQGSDDQRLTLQQPKRLRLKVHEIIDLKGELSYRLALMPMQDAQHFLQWDDNVSGLMVSVTSPFNANTVLSNALSLLPFSVNMRSWEYDYGYIYRDIQIIRSIMYLSMVLVIGVACFNIVSTLVIAVKDKSRDIAVLRTLGADDTLIRRIFIYYGFLAGLIGSVIGCLLGVVVSLNLSALMRVIESLIGYRFLSDNIYFINFIPSELNPVDIIAAFITALVLSLVASWFTSRRASKIEPVIVLNER